MRSSIGRMAWIGLGCSAMALLAGKSFGVVFGECLILGGGGRKLLMSRRHGPMDELSWSQRGVDAHRGELAVDHRHFLFFVHPRLETAVCQ